jgi:methylenetetrahydrofolate reductase (NADPH)
MPNVPLSFEFFPPKTEAAVDQLWVVLQRLKSFKPAFVSVTYGAGGSTRERTQQLVAKIQQQGDVAAAAHLTCVGANRAEIAEVVDGFWQAGIRHIVALRGDLPAGEGGIDVVDGYPYAADLVAGLKAQYPDLTISVAAYPEPHPQAVSPQADLENLKRKFDAGATQAITQFFFDPSLYSAFVERAQKIGIHQPIIPGILPVHNFAQMERFAQLCGTKVPDSLRQRLGGLDPDSAGYQDAAVEQATDLCQQLLASGAPALHFYTMNRSVLVERVVNALGYHPKG